MRSIERAIQDDEGIKETDLEAYRQYRKTQVPALIYLSVNHEIHVLDIIVGFTARRELMIPWWGKFGEDVNDVLTNGQTHIEIGDEELYPQSVSELFYGDTKVFLVCTFLRGSNG